MNDVEIFFKLTSGDFSLKVLLIKLTIRFFDLRRKKKCYYTYDLIIISA